jgi:hypothetical protein
MTHATTKNDFKNNYNCIEPTKDVNIAEFIHLNVHP